MAAIGYINSIPTRFGRRLILFVNKRRRKITHFIQTNSHIFISRQFDAIQRF